ncbi:MULTISPECIES: ABC transporter substrate-binding protein [Actinomycetes]|uniref:ABC transporter substrate-binding protein n=1 Tax=Actinomycetes TaxID=1760 RepID=UPI0004BF9973|nr:MULTISPECIES: ABC transporter substrate-binding protein [Actinomycetes]
MKRLSRLRVGIIAALIVALAVSACGKSDDLPEGALAPKEVKLATVGSYLTIFSAAWAAENTSFKEIEEKYGTKLTFQTFGKGADAMTATLGGSVDINTGTSSTDIVEAVLKKQDLVAVDSLFTGPGSVLIGRKDLEASHGTNIKAYDGASWGYTAEGSSAQLHAQKEAEYAGLDWDNQKGIALGSVQAFEPALKSGRTDIAAMDTTSAAIAISNGSGYLVRNMNDLTLHGPVVGPIPGNLVAIPSAFIEKFPEFTQALVTAFVEGLREVQNAKDANAAYALMPESFKKVHQNDAQFAVEWDLARPAFLGTDGGFNQANIDAIAKYIDEDPAQVETAFNDTFVDAAYKEIGVERADAGIGQP